MLQKDEKRLCFDDIVIDVAARELLRGGSTVAVEPQVFDLIALLAHNPKHVLDRDEIIEAVWNGRIVSDSAIANRINAARAALGDNGRKQRYIKTIRGRGFRFEARPEQGPPSQAITTDDSNNFGFPAGDQKLSIAVLPFNSSSQKDEHDPIADGMTEDIITELSRIRNLFVIARNSSFAYRNQSSDMARIARELSVNYLLKGGIRHGNGRIRVTAQLVDGFTGDHVWAERYDRVFDDVFDLQDEITERVVSAIEPNIIAAETARVSRQHPNNLDAWEHVAAALPKIWSWKEDAYRSAEAHLNRAIEIDATYARAHAVLAAGHVIQAWMGWRDNRPPKENVRRAIALGRIAVDLDTKDPWAHMALGFAHAVNRHHVDALSSLERSLELNHNFALAWACYAKALSWCGRPEDALRAFEIAARASPRDPMNEVYPSMEAIAHFVSGDYQECIRKLQYTLRFRPDIPGPYRLLTAAYAKLGNIDAASETFIKVRELQPDISAAWMREYFPFVRDEDIEKYVEALVLAGMPEATEE